MTTRPQAGGWKDGPREIKNEEAVLYRVVAGTERHLTSLCPDRSILQSE